MDININLTKRVRRRKFPDGRVVTYERYVLNYRDPLSGARCQRFFDRKRDAEARMKDLNQKVAEGSYVEPKTVPTVAEAVAHWLSDRQGKVKATTLDGYKQVCKAITGPLLEGTAQERADYTQSGVKPKGARFLHLLGPVKLDQLTTAAIRTWHRTVVRACGAYTANRAKSHLRSVLALAEEDYRVRAPSMPTGLSRGPRRGQEGHPDPGRIAHDHCRRQGRPGAWHLLRLPVPRRHAAERAARPAVVRGRLRARASSASAASRSATARSRR